MDPLVVPTCTSIKGGSEVYVTTGHPQSGNRAKIYNVASRAWRNGISSFNYAP